MKSKTTQNKISLADSECGSGNKMSIADSECGSEKKMSIADSECGSGNKMSIADSECGSEKKTNHSQISEKEYLSSYNINEFSRPSIATDITLFSAFAKESACHRKDAEPELSILLIKRGEHPYLNQWALPGGFLEDTETVEDCAIRELEEETGITPSTIFPIGIFSTPERDPRGRIISSSYLAITNEENVKATDGGDAIDAKWFSVKFEKTSEEIFRLTLESEGDILEAYLSEKETPFPNLKYEIISNSGLAFDHAKIIAVSLFTLREQAEKSNVVFNFLPEKFTLASMQKVQEILTGTSLIVANYRRKIIDTVVETEEYTEGAGHRPARLFKRK